MASLKIGAQGVGALHQSLVEAGERVSREELGAQVFGPSTWEAVKHFQSHHVDAKGRALTVDGVVGPSTAWALENPGADSADYKAPGWRFDGCAPELGPVLTAAISQIGTYEVPDGSNHVAANRYGNEDASGALPWCACFVSWAFGHLAGGSPFGVLWSAWKVQDWGKRTSRVIPPGAELRPGDLGVVLKGDGHGHVYMVATVLAGGKVCTVEGNAANAVRGLLRDRDDATCFVRPVGEI